MTEIFIDAEKAVRLLERAVAEKGAGYVYDDLGVNECQYQRAGEPSCIVGHALSYEGVPVSSLAHFDLCEDSSIGVLYGTGDLAGEGVQLTNEAVDIFETAQVCQDLGFSWGHSVEGAKAGHGYA